MAIQAPTHGWSMVAPHGDPFYLTAVICSSLPSNTSYGHLQQQVCRGLLVLPFIFSCFAMIPVFWNLFECSFRQILTPAHSNSPPMQGIRRCRAISTFTLMCIESKHSNSVDFYSSPMCLQCFSQRLPIARFPRNCGFCPNPFRFSL